MKTAATISVEVRQRLGITQVELGQILGCAPATVTRWEGGNKEPNGWRLALLEVLHQDRRRTPPVRRWLATKGTIYALKRLLAH